MSPPKLPETEPVKSTPFKGMQPEDGEGERETDKEGEPILTVTLSETEPAEPQQFKVNVFEEVKLEIVCEPEVDL